MACLEVLVLMAHVGCSICLRRLPLCILFLGITLLERFGLRHKLYMSTMHQMQCRPRIHEQTRSPSSPGCSR